MERTKERLLFIASAIAMLLFCAPAIAGDISTGNLFILCQVAAAPPTGGAITPEQISQATCRNYLHGVFDGMLAAGKVSGMSLICPREPPPEPAQLAEYFMVATTMVSHEHNFDEPAVTMAMAAFRVAMPCK